MCEREDQSGGRCLTTFIVYATIGQPMPRKFLGVDAAHPTDYSQTESHSNDRMTPKHCYCACLLKSFSLSLHFSFFSGCTRQNGSKSTRRMSAVHAHSSLSPFVLGHMGPWGWCQSLESPDEAFVKDAKTNCYKPASLFWILMEGET